MDDTARSATLRVGDSDVTLLPMGGDDLRLWLEIEAEAALLRSSIEARLNPSFVESDPELLASLATQGLLPAMAADMIARKPSREEQEAALRSLLRADDALAYMAVAHAGRSDLDAIDIVVHTDDAGRATIVRAQSALNRVGEAGLEADLIAVAFARVFEEAAHG